VAYRPVHKSCGKVRFKTHYQANKALLECWRKRTVFGHQERTEMSAYYCHRCKGFHLTSMAQPPWKS
jgi:hypothetical protein